MEKIMGLNFPRQLNAMAQVEVSKIIDYPINNEMKYGSQWDQSFTKMVEMAVEISQTDLV